ncbi:MAG: response regulator [Oxalicibacterium faecigallinarum]|uniref:response regulator n=1 Tax=Oxalicibacterium faecigallinarum TaxID=573741 RepID=UPI002809EF4E|nr:response regulator [Oxalicibacterium faecigallinarum]MDQ7968223.1 response regulator [Oxalicibacterium faecigallinarum]
MTTINDNSITQGNLPLRVFLVEDSLEIRDLMVENMAMIDGLSVAGMAESEDEALTQLQAEPFDILIVDIQLKKGNGINLLRNIAEDQKFTNALKIICSNNATEVFRRVGRQYGVNHFYDKTSEFPQLFALLQQIASQQDHRQQA